MQAKNVSSGTDTKLRDCWTESQVVKHVHGIGAKLNASADLAKLWGLLKELDVVSRFREAARGSQTANAAARN
jgi:hypothetical protein